MQLKSNTLNIVTQQGIILTSNCLVCDTPIFFSWEGRKQQLVCKKCGSLHKLLYSEKIGTFSLAIVVNIFTNDGMVKCERCETAFEPNEIDGVFDCPNCHTLYYNQKAKLLRQIHKRLGLSEDDSIVKKVRI